MQAGSWKRIEDLCQVALDLAPEKPAAFLAQACADRCTVAVRLLAGECSRVGGAGAEPSFLVW